MKFYSEELKRFFNTEKDCLEAEQAHADKERIEKTRLAEIHKLEKEYKEKVDAFIKDYGYYSSEEVEKSFKEYFTYFFN